MTLNVFLSENKIIFDNSYNNIGRLLLKEHNSNNLSMINSVHLHIGNYEMKITYTEKRQIFKENEMGKYKFWFNLMGPLTEKYYLP